MFFESLPKFQALKTYQQRFLRLLVQLALVDQEKNKICAALTVAQAILESKWGVSGLTAKTRNLFGMKGTFMGHGMRCTTQEYSHLLGKMYTTTAVFKLYPDWQASVDDHSGLFYRLDRYKKLRGCLDWQQAVRFVMDAGYATDNKYEIKLLALIRAYELWRLDDMVSAVEPAPLQAVAVYRVQAGDTLWKIASKQLGSGIRWGEIAVLNGLKSTVINCGQVLKLPARGS